jgi:ubiquinone/menaquinone biosynthesis C-methylase UbiE
MTVSNASFPPRPTALAQDFIKRHLLPGDCAIDATTGNGHDTHFLAECVGATGRVLAFDVQSQALVAARERVGEMDWVELYHQSHREMDQHALEASVATVMFNLGYLPGENHELTTEATETLAALDVACRLLKPGGLLSVICYPGHPSGAVEAAAVEGWMTGLPAQGWRVAKYAALGTRRPAPFLLIAAKALTECQLA